MNNFCLILEVLTHFMHIQYLDKLIGDDGLLLKFCSADFKDIGIRILALHCIGSIVIK